MRVLVSMYDPSDFCTYTLIFSREDAQRIIELESGTLIKLKSIGGNFIHKDGYAIIHYENGVGQFSSIYTSYHNIKETILAHFESDCDD
ncbi:MAG: hypothetical protein Sw2LagTSB_02960 [Shewanella algae]